MKYFDVVHNQTVWRHPICQVGERAEAAMEVFAAVNLDDPADAAGYEAREAFPEWQDVLAARFRAFTLEASTGRRPLRSGEACWR